MKNLENLKKKMGPGPTEFEIEEKNKITDKLQSILNFPKAGTMPVSQNPSGQNSPESKNTIMKSQLGFNPETTQEMNYFAFETTVR